MTNTRIRASSSRTVHQQSFGQYTANFKWRRRAIRVLDLKWFWHAYLNEDIEKARVIIRSAEQRAQAFVDAIAQTDGDCCIRSRWVQNGLLFCRVYNTFVGRSTYLKAVLNKPNSRSFYRRHLALAGGEGKLYLAQAVNSMPFFKRKVWLVFECA